MILRVIGKSCSLVAHSGTMVALFSLVLVSEGSMACFAWEGIHGVFIVNRFF